MRNWSFESLYPNKNLKFNEVTKIKIVELYKNKISVPQIAQLLELDPNKIRNYLKKTLSTEDYSINKLVNRKLSKKSKIISEELAYIMGVMFGDGYFGEGLIGLGTKDEDFSEYFIKTVKKWCDKEPLRYQRKRYGRPYYECYLSFKDAVCFIRSTIEERSKIPEVIRTSSDLKIIRSFIMGFSDSEGSITTKDGKNFLKMANQKLLVLSQIKELMLKLGFNQDKVYIVFNNQAKNGKVYAIRICYKDQIKLFYETIGFTIKRKQSKLDKLFKQNLMEENVDMAAIV